MANAFRGIICLPVTLAVLAFAAIADVPSRGASPHAAVPGGDGPATTERAEPAYTFALQLSPQRPLYYTIETTLRDSGGVPPLLSYATTVEDRKSFTQKVIPNAEADPDGVQVTWECDRYEVREKGMKEDVSFDSLRDLYPMPTLYGLGGIPGSQSMFVLDPRTGNASGIRIQLAPVKGGGGDRLSKTAGKCRLDAGNLGELLDQLGPLYMPGAPKRVGEQWTRTLREVHQNLGVVVTELTCTLQSVREVDGRKVATIDLNGEVRLAAKNEQTAPTQTTSAPASQPARSDTQPAIQPADESTAPPGSRTAAQPADPPATQPAHAPADQHGRQPASRPMDESPGTAGRQSTTRPERQPMTQPASQPTTTQPSKPSRRLTKPLSKERDYRLDRKEYVGSVEFDLTRGELVRMNLRQQVEFVAELDQKEPNPLVSHIRSGTLRELRVQVADMAPAKPVIIGGPKPPVAPAAETDRSGSAEHTPSAPTSRRSSSATGRRSLSPDQPAGGEKSDAATSQPAVRRAKPAAARPAIDRRTPRRRPAKVAASQPAPPDARKPQLVDRPGP